MKEGPFGDFNAAKGGHIHLHESNKHWSEYLSFLTIGIGFIPVDEVTFKITDYCPAGLHNHPDGTRVNGTDIEIKPVR